MVPVEGPGTRAETRWPGGWGIRVFLSLLLVVIAAVCGFLGVLLPIELASESDKDRAYYRQFQSAAAYVDRTGRLPPEPVPGAAQSPDAERSVQFQLIEASECDDAAFTKGETDRIVLTFWRGAWAECYAYSSGRTTLHLSLGAYLRAGWWQAIAAFGTIFVLAIAGTIGLVRQLRRLRAPMPS